MKITLLVDTFNSLSQAIYTALKDLGYRLDIVYAINKEQTIEELNAFYPDIILSPYLTKFIPKEIFNTYPTFVLHPGVRGDRGSYSLEYALISHKEWGIVWLRANELFDGGDIYASSNFAVRDVKKSSLYRKEVKESALSSLASLLENIETDNKEKQLLNPLHKAILPKDFAIDWSRDKTVEIIKKINLFDSQPGLIDEILALKCHLFGAWEEEKLKGKPKEVLAKRDGAICLGTIDGAVWISHLKEPNCFKLPATYVLKERLKGVKEQRLPLIFDKSYKTFYEISCDIKDNIGYLHFNFYNGAISTAQAIRLKYAFDYIKEQVDAIVLMGAEQFFSNGIDLNILEDSKKQGEDGWANINAINDLISSIIYADSVITIASLHNNAGAGGVFLALACDFVVAKESTVLNPHYKTLGLSGSEYHTYTLPKRVGKELAQKLLNECLPISANYAKKINLIDEVFESDYMQNLHQFALSKIDEDFLWDKQDYLEENKEFIESLKKEELRVMYPEFWEENSPFHTLRREFVYKICPTKTPLRLKNKTLQIKKEEYARI